MTINPVTTWRLAVAAALPWFTCCECMTRIPFGAVVATPIDRDNGCRCLSCVQTRVLRDTLNPPPTWQQWAS